MAVLNELYKSSLTLLTDLYQLTMAYGYWQQGMADHEAVFHLFFRKNPFKGGYTVACGLQTAVEFLERFGFDESDIAYLAEQRGNDGKSLFEPGFLAYLKAMRLTCHVDAIPEGTVVFPHEPLLRITGPLIQCQLLETALLNILNFQTLIATKAARTVQAAQGEPVLEFGLRRAQGIDGAISASRAAFVGGCASTSNVLAGKLYGIPIRGTHAHSWVMSFDTELEAFEQYASAMPNNCVFLVDTYDTLQGVRHAVDIGRRLRERGHEMIGVRLDSGDLAYLSIEARKILDEGGFPKAAVIASNDLDENLIKSLKEQGARISVWGVGTNLVTAADQPALGGVYKLSAIRAPGKEWKYRVKLSEQLIKVSNPGIQQVRRYTGPDGALADMIYDIERPPSGEATIVDPMDMTRRKHVPADVRHEDLLHPVFRDGDLVADLPTLAEIRLRAQSQLTQFHSGVRRFDNPHQYPVGLEQGLFDRKMDLVLKARGEKP
jgi:nicotinate phosphoribosyltransferase